MCSSGDSQLKASEQAQANFTNSLMSTFKTQFANQQDILKFITGKMEPIINNPQGFTPEQLAAMNTRNVEGSATSFANAEKATNELTAGRGNGLPSGVSAQISAENANDAARQEATGENQIALENAEQQQNNYWNALNVLGGASAQENPLGYAGAANSGSGEVAGLGDAFKSSQSSQLLGALGGLAGGAGSAVGAYFGHK